MCPVCSAPTRVRESRSAEGGGATRRRRECVACGRRFTTFERRQAERLEVLKRSGERQRFDREKLRTALLRAAHKRDVSAADVDRIVARIEAEAMEQGGELSSGAIGERCLAELRELDVGAFMQFAGTLPEPRTEIAESD